MEHTGSKLISGSILRFLTLVAMVIVTFLLTPFIIGCIGNKMFGFWSLVGSFLGVSGILDLGLSTALKRYFPKFYETNNAQKINQVFCSSLFLFTIIGGTVAIAIFALIRPLYGWIGNEIPIGIFTSVFVVLGIDAALQFPMRTHLGYFEGRLRYDVISGIELIKTAVRAVLIYYFLTKDYGIAAMVIISLFANMFSYALLIGFYQAKYRDIKIAAVNINSSTIKMLFNYSYKNMIAAIALAFKFQIDNFVIATFAGVSAVTPYVIGSRIAQAFVDAISAFMGQTVPIFSKIDARGDKVNLKRVYFLLLKMSTILSVYVGGMLFILGKDFILRWMGKGFESSYTVLIILTFGLTMALCQFPTYNLLQGISKHYIYAICSLGEGIANLVLSVILVRSYGIVGVAFGTTIPMVLISMVVLPYLTSREVSYISLVEIYFKSLGPAFVKSVALMALIYLSLSRLVEPDYVRLFLLCLLSLLYFPVSYILGFSKYEKGYYLFPSERIKSIFQRA